VRKLKKKTKITAINKKQKSNPKSEAVEGAWMNELDSSGKAPLIALRANMNKNNFMQ
jgi:hypothetical protein